MIRGVWLGCVAFLVLTPSLGMVVAHPIFDYDPLVDIVVFVDIQEIRSLSPANGSVADYYVTVRINDQSYTSPVWRNVSYIECGPWTCSLDVPDDVALVRVVISLWKANSSGDQLCDICGKGGDTPEGLALHLLYDIRTAKWTGDDRIGDPSGYGRGNGCYDGKGSQRDCELFFRIRQTDYDGDGIPYWAEVYLLGTDPTINDSLLDPDKDGIPTSWEYRWGYNPLVWEDHAHLDPDADGLTNLMEYRMAAWGPDPFRRDVFVEVDAMETGPAGENSSVPHGAFELVRTPFAVRNIVLRFDVGQMGGGGESLPFDNLTTRVEEHRLYEQFFLHGNASNWRRDVFRWFALLYYDKAPGMSCVGERTCSLLWHCKGTNCCEISLFQVSRRYANQSLAVRNFMCASVIMHELGHTFGNDRWFPVGSDCIMSYYPGTLAGFIFKNYRSVMNYEYTYHIVDYSDGSHGFGDHDDWDSLDFEFFLPRQ